MEVDLPVTEKLSNTLDTVVEDLVQLPLDQKTVRQNAKRSERQTVADVIGHEDTLRDRFKGMGMMPEDVRTF